MSTIGWIILAVVVVAVLLLALAVWRSARRRVRSERAHEMRSEARGHAAEIGTSRAEAQEAEARATAARLEADRVQREADAAKTALAQDEAAHEDRLREADRIDPAVNHRARDYEPTTPDEGVPGAPGVVDGEGDGTPPGDGAYPSNGGAHRAPD